LTKAFQHDEHARISPRGTADAGPQSSLAIAAIISSKLGVPARHFIRPCAGAFPLLAYPGKSLPEREAWTNRYCGKIRAAEAVTNTNRHAETALRTLRSARNPLLFPFGLDSLTGQTGDGESTSACSSGHAPWVIPGWLA
jgi:hypothetical protein